MKWQAIVLIIWVLLNTIVDCVHEYKSSVTRTGKLSSGLGSILGVILRYGSWAWLAYECGLRLGVSI